MSYPLSPLIPSGKKVLVICEKPSIARDLARVLGAGSASPGDGFIPFSLGYISWARGHMLEMAAPSDYRADWEDWQWGNLPMIPEGLKFHRNPKSDCRGQLSVLKKLYSSCDIIVNACDAGREGELIWWEILRHCGWGAGYDIPKVGPKPALRFWAQSNTSAGLSEAWEAMKPVESRAGLAEGAYARSEADWLLGLNLTRGATLGFVPPDLGGNKKGFWSVGRVQTPILALIAERDNCIINFKSEPFYQIKATFLGLDKDKEKDTFEALVCVPVNEGIKAFEADETDSDSPGKPREQKSFLTKEGAQKVLDRILSNKSESWNVSEETKKSVENPPGLFSLTSLQKWANQHWGWEAKRTLDAAQGAYESDKSLTYPRTDASFLPVDSKSKVQSVYEDIVKHFLAPNNYNLPSGALAPSSSSRSSYLFDDSKLTDHYAIIPTGVIPKDLSSDSGRIWLAVLRRFVVAFSDPAKVSTLKRKLTLLNDLALVTGKSYDYRGWVDVDDSLCGLTGHKPKSDANMLAPCGSMANLLDAKLHQGATTPPKHFTEATLLALMENIHTKFEDSEDELKEALAGKGLGTPATRAAIIELLIARKYIVREKKGATTYLKVTQNGHSLINNLKELRLDFLIAPQLTAQWEEKLGDMEKGVGLSRHEFLVELSNLVSKSIETLKASAQEKGISHRASHQEVDTGLVCPISGEKIIDRGGFWQFPAYPNARFYKEVAKKTLELSQMIDILKGQSPLISGFVSKKGAKFAARLEFSKEDEKLKFVFDQDSGIVAQDCDVLCPKTGKPISDHGQFWTFPENTTKFWKIVAKRKMKISDYVELVREGKTKVFDNFVSKAGNKFSAALVLSKDQVSFEFPDRGKSMSPSMKGPGAKGSKSGAGADKKSKKTW